MLLLNNDTGCGGLELTLLEVVRVLYVALLLPFLLVKSQLAQELLAFQLLLFELVHVLMPGRGQRLDRLIAIQDPLLLVQLDHHRKL